MLFRSKKEYYKCKKETAGLGYYHTQTTDAGWSINIFTDTGFPSVLRNLKTLIHTANAMKYEKYFYIEDDHYIDDRDFQRVHDYFTKLDNHDLLVFTYKRYGNTSDNKEMVTCSYFHYGRSESMCKISEKFPYTAKDFIERNKYIYLQFYEYMFGSILREYAYEGFKVYEESFTDIGVSLAFPHSKINMYYSFYKKDTESRTTLLYDESTNRYMHYYNSAGLTEIVNLKYFLRSQLVGEINLNPGCWQVWIVDVNDINDFVVVIDDKIKHDFSTQVIRDVIYNGEVMRH